MLVAKSICCFFPNSTIAIRAASFLIDSLILLSNSLCYVENDEKTKKKKTRRLLLFFSFILCSCVVSCRVVSCIGHEEKREYSIHSFPFCALHHSIRLLHQVRLVLRIRRPVSSSNNEDEDDDDISSIKNI